ncbi:ubiquitin-like protein 3 [Rhagoletis pomonella]|uniref:ubiquitin-like protein 3 n=1 Tax=Rhagoletis pomonella TaxID=28610 RepID=UPI00178242EC|nr:ubiquitin-like protein 3 [Rhagoletis pomonella]
MAHNCTLVGTFKVLHSQRAITYTYNKCTGGGSGNHNLLSNDALAQSIADWEREAVSKAEILRLIYQGRFLHCNVTLGALGLPLGKTTVMHLVPRDNLPEPNSQDQRQKSKGGSSRCCSTTCCIL